MLGQGHTREVRSMYKCNLSQGGPAPLELELSLAHVCLGVQRKLLLPWPLTWTDAAARAPLMLARRVRDCGW
eukprot:2778205-Rhodomonas_salina.1